MEGGRDRGQLTIRQRRVNRLADWGGIGRLTKSSGSGSQFNWSCVLHSTKLGITCNERRHGGRLYMTQMGTLEIRVAPENWGDARVSDIAQVLASAGETLAIFFPDWTLSPHRGVAGDL